MLKHLPNLCLVGTFGLVPLGQVAGAAECFETGREPVCFQPAIERVARQPGSPFLAAAAVDVIVAEGIDQRFAAAGAGATVSVEDCIPEFLPPGFHSGAATGTGRCSAGFAAAMTEPSGPALGGAIARGSKTAFAEAAPRCHGGSAARPTPPVGNRTSRASLLVGQPIIDGPLEANGLRYRAKGDVLAGEETPDGVILNPERPSELAYALAGLVAGHDVPALFFCRVETRFARIGHGDSWMVGVARGQRVLSTAGPRC